MKEGSGGYSITYTVRIRLARGRSGADRFQIVRGAVRYPLERGQRAPFDDSWESFKKGGPGGLCEISTKILNEAPHFSIRGPVPAKKVTASWDGLGRGCGGRHGFRKESFVDREKSIVLEKVSEKCLY